jgi:hypothetical protein
VRAHEKEVAPGAVLGAEGELLERGGLELLRLRVVGLCEDEVVDNLRDPAEVAAVERLARVAEQRVRAARQRDVPFAAGLRRVHPEVRGVAVYQPR